MMHRAVLTRSTARTIMAAVAAFHGLDTSDLSGLRRERPAAWARQEACWALRLRTELSSVSIGRMVNRDHTTVLTAIASVERRRSADPEYRQRTDALLGHVDQMTGKGLAGSDPAEPLAPILRELAGLHARLSETLSAVEAAQADLSLIHHHGVPK